MGLYAVNLKLNWRTRRNRGPENRRLVEEGGELCRLSGAKRTFQLTASKAGFDPLADLTRSA